MKNIHATCVSYQNEGILLLGKSKAGKSDLALRLIENKGATLVSDDRVDLELKDGELTASAPAVLAGLLEVRGVGSCRLRYQKRAKIKLVVELVAKEDVERLPKPAFWEFEGKTVPLLKLDAFEISAADKIVIKLKAALDLG